MYLVRFEFRIFPFSIIEQRKLEKTLIGYSFKIQEQKPRKRRNKTKDKEGNRKNAQMKLKVE
jgi:hypothetical protein